MIHKTFYPLLENPFRKKDLDAATKVVKSGRITIRHNTKVFRKTFQTK